MTTMSDSSSDTGKTKIDDASTSADEKTDENKFCNVEVCDNGVVRKIIIPVDDNAYPIFPSISENTANEKLPIDGAKIGAENRQRRATPKKNMKQSEKPVSSQNCSSEKMPACTNLGDKPNETDNSNLKIEPSNISLESQVDTGQNKMPSKLKSIAPHPTLSFGLISNKTSNNLKMNSTGLQREQDTVSNQLTVMNQPSLPNRQLICVGNQQYVLVNQQTNASNQQQHFLLNQQSVVQNRQQFVSNQQPVVLNQQQLVLNTQAAQSVIPNQQRFVLNSQSSVPNQQRFILNQQSVVPNQQRFILNQQSVVSNQQQLILNTQSAIPNQQQQFILNRQSVVPNQQQQFVLNQQSVVPNQQQQFVLNQQSVVPNQQQFVLNQQSVVPNQQQFVLNQQSVVPNQQQFVSNQQPVVSYQQLFVSNQQPAFIQQKLNTFNQPQTVTVLTPQQSTSPQQENTSSKQSSVSSEQKSKNSIASSNKQKLTVAQQIANSNKSKLDTLNKAQKPNAVQSIAPAWQQSQQPIVFNLGQPNQQPIVLSQQPVIVGQNVNQSVSNQQQSIRPFQQPIVLNLQQPATFNRPFLQQPVFVNQQLSNVVNGTLQQSGSNQQFSTVFNQILTQPTISSQQNMSGQQLVMVRTNQNLPTNVINPKRQSVFKSKAMSNKKSAADVKSSTGRTRIRSKDPQSKMLNEQVQANMLTLPPGSSFIDSSQPSSQQFRPSQMQSSTIFLNQPQSSSQGQQPRSLANNLINSNPVNHAPMSSNTTCIPISVFAVQSKDSRVEARNTEGQAHDSKRPAQDTKDWAQNTESQGQAQDSKRPALDTKDWAQNTESQAQNSKLPAQDTNDQAQNTEGLAQSSKEQAQDTQGQAECTTDQAQGTQGTKEQAKGTISQAQDTKCQVQGTKGLVQCTTDQAQGIKVQAQSPKGQVQISPKGKVQSPKGRVQSPRGRVQSPRGHVQSPRGQVQSPKGQVQSPKGQVHGTKYRSIQPKPLCLAVVESLPTHAAFTKSESTPSANVESKSLTPLTSVILQSKSSQDRLNADTNAISVESSLKSTPRLKLSKLNWRNNQAKKMDKARKLWINKESDLISTTPTDSESNAALEGCVGIMDIDEDTEYDIVGEILPVPAPSSDGAENNLMLDSDDASSVSTIEYSPSKKKSEDNNKKAKRPRLQKNSNSTKDDNYICVVKATEKRSYPRTRSFARTNKLD